MEISRLWQPCYKLIRLPPGCGILPCRVVTTLHDGCEMVVQIVKLIPKCRSYLEGYKNKTQPLASCLDSYRYKKRIRKIRLCQLNPLSASTVWCIFNEFLYTNGNFGTDNSKS